MPRTTSAGQLTLNITDSIQVLDFNQVIPIAFSVISSANLGNNQGGNINLSTKKLLIDNGAGLGTITIGGQGNAGSLSINAEDITVSGVNPMNTLPSSLFSSTVGQGQGGETMLKTSSLNILEGGQISSGSGSSGNAGDIFIEADQLNLISNADVRPIIGDINTSRIVAIAAPPTPAQQVIVGNSIQVTGSSGNINIDSGDINIERARITVSNQGQGSVGNVNVKADSLTNIDGVISASGLSELRDINLSGGSINIDTDFLISDDGSFVAATNFVGSGGNVNINSDVVILDNSSFVSAASGSITDNQENSTGNGGNIVINAETLFGINRSIINANAARGNGGNINITAGIILGIEANNEQIFNNSITASSELGIDGTIKIDTLDINLQKELEQSKLKLIPANEAIANSCLARSSGQANFTISGNDKFPKNPNSNYSDTDFSLTGVGSLPANVTQPSSTLVDNSQYNQSMIPAKKMMKREDGRIFLVAAPRSAKSFFCQDVEEK